MNFKKENFKKVHKNDNFFYYFENKIIKKITV